MSPVWKRIKRLREQSGKSPDEMAEKLGINVLWYYDIESGNDVYDTLMLLQVKILGDELSVRPSKLFCDEKRINNANKCDTFQRLVTLMQKHISEHNISLSTFADEINFDIASAMENPATIWSSWNIDCLRNACNALRIDWLNVFEGEYERVRSHFE